MKTYRVYDREKGFTCELLEHVPPVFRWWVVCTGSGLPMLGEFVCATYDEGLARKMAEVLNATETVS